MLFFKVTASFWLLSLVLSAINILLLSRMSLILGCIVGIAGCIFALPIGTTLASFPFSLSLQSVHFSLNAAALWLMGFGLFPALFACWVSRLRQSALSQRYWLAGMSSALLGALGVFGLQDAISFLISWELMSFGVAVMLLAEKSNVESGSSVLFMLSILEVGAIAILVALLLLSQNGENLQFSLFAKHALTFSTGKQLVIALLLLFGFGAKLGLVPFYEWFPGAYSSGSGATGSVASGVILNAAFFGLMRGLFAWLPISNAEIAIGVIVILVGVLTALLTILHAFQQNDWRRMLSYSSAENAAISVLILGVALLFRQEQQFNLAALAGVVALIHLAGHSLAKGTLFLVADGIYCSNQSYAIEQNGILKQLGWFYGVGALFAAMSLSAMPPQAGFVSEWYVFQTIFHGFYLENLLGRFALLAAGVGMALTAAIALATFVKGFGVGLLGANCKPLVNIPRSIKISVFVLGISVLLLAVGMIVWINALSLISQNWFSYNAPAVMHDGWLLVPLSAHFAFISPTLLVIVTPFLALFPAIFLIRKSRYPIKRACIWYGGLRQDRKLVATTALTFSNAMQHFYRFVYLPKREIKREYSGKPYFIKSVSFSQKTTDMFSTYLFSPIVKFIQLIAEKIRLFQSGNLNFYSLVIGVLFVLILLTVFFPQSR